MSGPVRDSPHERSGASEHADLLGEAYRRDAEYFGRVAFLLTNSSDRAEDLVQEAFARLAGRVSQISDPQAVTGYLRTTIVNLAINSYRRRDTERAYLRRWGHTHHAAATAPPDLETRQHLIEILASLPVRQRAVVVLKYFEDLPEKEIAAVLGCPVGTVKSSLSRALAAMRVTMAEGDRDE